MTNVDVIRNLYAAFARKDDGAIRELFDPAIEWNQMEGFPGGGRHVGPEAVFRDVFGKFRDEWTVWKAPVDEVLDAGDAVIVVGSYEGTHAKNGRSFRAPFAHLYRLKHGRIVRFDQYTDTRLIADAMGL